jgi:aminoglycoside phosphotransferase (APT) family kinase protein
MSASLPGISRALRAAFPDLALSGLRLVGTGFGSTVVETGDGLIARIGRTTAAARGHAVEATVLPVLAPMLPVGVPVPACYRPPGDALPFGAICYRRLPGQPGQSATVTSLTAQQLGAFLAVLHAADSRRLPAMPGPGAVWRRWHALRAATDPLLGRMLTGQEGRRLGRWWDRFLSDQRMWRYPPAVRHGDLWHGNLLIQPDGTISAVLDWEEVAVADPAQDLALSRYLGPACTNAVLAAYRDGGGAWDHEVRHRMQRHWEVRELTGIPLALEVGDDAEVSECIAKLRAGPILST